MRAVVQRVTGASVTAAGVEISRIGNGLVVLAAIGKGDSDEDVSFMARKLAGLRIFDDEGGRMNRNLQQAGGAVLLVSQFTLFGDVRKGNRPSFDDAEEPDKARTLFELLALAIASQAIPVCTGRFRAEMQLSLTNDGPVTILLDSRKLF